MSSSTGVQGWAALQVPEGADIAGFLKVAHALDRMMRSRVFASGSDATGLKVPLLEALRVDAQSPSSTPGPTAYRANRSGAAANSSRHWVEQKNQVWPS